MVLAVNEWFLWTVLAFFMIGAKRYFAHKYGLAMTIHVVFATIASGLTMFLGLNAKSHLGWNFYQVHFHNKLATSMMFIAPVAYGLGFVTLLIMKYYSRDPKWSN